MKEIKQYKIEVTQLIRDEKLDHDDRLENPSGTYYLEAETENSALDEFHETVAISCLEDFDIAISEV